MHATDTASEVQSFRHQAQIANTVVKRNLEGLTHEESLVQPQPGGNCLNWIVGHLVEETGQPRVKIGRSGHK